MIRVFDSDGNLIEEEGEPWWPKQSPMSPHEVIATLNAVLGVWSLQDAANAIGRTPEDLIAEAQAWAVASNQET